MNNNFELTTLEEYSDEALLNELRRVADELKGERLTHEKFNKLGRVHSTTLRYRFGSWEKALDRAGISESIAPRAKPLTRESLMKAIREYAEQFPNTPIAQDEIARKLGVNRGTISRNFGKWECLLRDVNLNLSPLYRRYTDVECFENIIVLWTHYGRQPHFAELNIPPSKVGSKAYVGRWGGWRAALGAFIRYVNNSSEVVEQPIENDINSASSSPSESQVIISKPINLSLRYKVLCRDRFRCVICGRSPAKELGVELHVDHIFPESKGGLSLEENLRTLCRDCNLGKGAKIETP